MGSEEMLLDRLKVAAGEREEGPRPPLQAQTPRGPLAAAEVPPMRTIVLDRPPAPVAPPLRERNPLREPSPSTAGPERLRLNQVSINYGGKPAVKSVSLSIHQGEVLALIGPSGCGKTTLLRTLNRLTELTPSAARAGEVLLDGEDIHELPDTTLGPDCPCEEGCLRYDRAAPRR